MRQAPSPSSRWRHLLVLLLFFSSICLGADAEPEPVYHPIPLETYTAIKEGIQLDVGAPSEPVTEKDSVLAITLTNRTATPIRERVYGDFPYFFITVFTAEGRPCERTAMGRNRVGPRNSGGWSTSVSFLYPGDAKTWWIPLQELFKLGPGKYTATVQRGEATAHDPLKITKIPFTLLD